MKTNISTRVSGLTLTGSILACTLGSATMAVTLGCARQAPVVMAPPVAPPPVAAAPQNGEVYDWKDVPQGQQVPINRGAFDQGGYQLYASSGETVVIPFVNQNLYVLKFGKSTDGSMYFVNDGAAPTLYVPDGGYLENASAQGAKWYPFPSDYRYERPVYVGLAPSWSQYVGMGWYPGMVYHGGYWGYNPWTPGFMYSPMVGLHFNIGGRPYYGWNNYSTYYRANPVNRVLVTNNRGFNYSSVGRRSGSSGFGSSGSVGRRPSGGFSGGLGTSSGRPGFGSSSSRPSGGFGSSRPSGAFGSSGSRPSGGFGSSSSRPSGSFGGGSGGFGSTPRRGSGSFGGGTGGFSSGSRPSGSFGSSSSSPTFGGSSGSRPSFGSSGSRPSGSFGGGSFGGGRRSGGFGGGRRR